MGLIAPSLGARRGISAMHFSVAGIPKFLKTGPQKIDVCSPPLLARQFIWDWVKMSKQISVL
jgi:hypothetical protein